MAFADDELHDFGEIGIGNLALGHFRAFIHNRDTIADTKQILEPMGDQDNAYATGLYPLNQGQNSFHLGYGESRCRLIHDQDLRIEGRSASDGNRLTLAAGKLGDH